MVESLRTSAQLTTVIEADMSNVVRLRTRVNTGLGKNSKANLGYFPFLTRAALDALLNNPAINASLDDDGTHVTYHDPANLGIAVDTPRGLLVPVIRNAGALGVTGLSSAINDLANRARANGLKPEHLVGGTFTITNTGSRGALFDTPIINPPQVAILGTGAVVERPVVVRAPESAITRVEIRPMIYLALSYDHRLIDGADAARYLNCVKEILECARFEVEHR